MVYHKGHHLPKKIRPKISGGCIFCGGRAWDYKYLSMSVFLLHSNISAKVDGKISSCQMGHYVIIFRLNLHQSDQMDLDWLLALPFILNSVCEKERKNKALQEIKVPPKLFFFSKNYFSLKFSLNKKKYFN